MKNIGILGGTFNPVHIEHVNLAREAKAELNLEKLYVVPTFCPPHKDTVPIDAKDRLNMLKIAFSGLDFVEVSDFEIAKGGISYTYQTAEHFKNLHKNSKVYLFVGSDMLKDFKTWKNPKQILQNVTLCAFKREGHQGDFSVQHQYFKKEFGVDFKELNFVGRDISSSSIRVRLSLGLSAKDSLDKGVEEYICQNNLYKEDLFTSFLRKNLTEKRLIHTANVVAVGVKKAKELNLSEKKVYLSCLLHDCAKYLDPKSFKDFSIDESYPSPVVHAFLGEYVARNVLGVEDEDVLSAIKYHTTGRANMTTLEKLVFVADMIEKGRNYEGVERLRELYLGDFENCFRKCLEEELIHLQNKKGDICPLTIEAYNYYIQNNYKQKKEG